MERKLLSLPSFFVLLLVAGIAFLAAPVADVQAQTAPTAVVALGTPAVVDGKVVATITFSAAVKVVGAGSPAATATTGFDRADVSVTKTITMPAAAAVTAAPLPAGEWTLTTPTTGANANKVWTVTVNKPTNSNGSIGIGILSTASFQEAANTGAYVYEAADAVSHSFEDHDGTKPTVSIALDSPAGSRSLKRFLVTFTFTDSGFATAGPTFALGSINVTGGSAKELGSLTGTSSPYTMKAYIQADSGVSEVLIGVAANAVMDAAGNGNDAIPHVRGATDTPPAVPTGTLRVVVDSTPPFVDISHVANRPMQDAAVSKTNVVTSIDVTFTVKEGSATGAETETDTLGTGDARELEKAEITVTGGTITEPVAKPETFKAGFTATITPEATATEVTISVNEGAVEDIAGNGNAETVTPVRVSTGYMPDDTGGEEQPANTGVGAALTGGKRGFTFPLPTIDATNRFVVLAKSNMSADNGLSVPGLIDIDDRYWQDLADFLAYDGGTIYLIGPDGRTTTKHDLIINEIMWGGDAYLSDPTRSQWIELYNTKTTKGDETGQILAGTWTIEFRAGIGPSTPPANMSDSFSNRELGNAHWEIPNVSGGKYGQSGRTQTSPGVAGSLRDLVSMRRKTDYDKIEKTDHKPAAGENRTEQLKGVPDGALAGSWEASTSRVNMSGTRKGTPGARHVVVVGTTGISKSVVFNEIANRSDKKFDWIELYNPGSSDVKINNWVLSKVTGVDKDDKLFKFESDENIVVPAKGFLLVVNEDPSETALAAGANVNNPNSKANNLPTKVYVNSGLDIPEKDYLLILRTEEKLKSHEKIVDIGGHLAGLTLVHAGSATELWPLKAWKRIKEDDLKQDDNKTWVRDKGKDLYHGDAWKLDGGFTGLGIDRNPASNRGPTSGTPGFDNGAIKDKVKDLKESNPVVISEIMFGTGSSGRRVPQWIELYNPSDMQAVKLNSWRLEVRNTNDPSESLNVELSYTLILPDVRVLPKQTVLIVSSSIGESTRNRFPSDRIINLWSNRSFRDITEATSPRDPILSSVGFYIKLSDPEKQVVDEVGNIDGTRRSDDTPDWILPGGNLEEGGRASMIRREGTFNDGTIRDSWISAAATNFAGKVGIKELYYGDEDDVGTPGYRAGGPLPVQLSSFYSKRNDAGAVIITWSTESELDNAGFNILRSLSRAGEFTRINAQLIPGAGTTGEKNTYTWTDTSARPNVVYYYQIEDVSLDGEHRTLRTTRLRGYVGAAGKATTIWGELKSRD